MRDTIFETNEVSKIAEQIGREEAKAGYCEIVKDNDYCITFKAAARHRWNVHMPGIIINGRELTVFKNRDYLHVDSSAINAQYVLRKGGLNKLMSIEIVAL